MLRSKTRTEKVSIETTADPPVEIGTRGTVGSLVMQEIEYFSRLQLGSRDSSKKPHVKVVVASSSSHSRPIVMPVVGAQKKKKRGGSSKLLPRMCSMVEISENRPVGVSGFGYRNLKSDVKKLQA